MSMGGGGGGLGFNAKEPNSITQSEYNFLKIILNSISYT